MPIPDFQTFLHPVLVLASQQPEIRMREIAPKAADILSISKRECEEHNQVIEIQLSEP